MIKKVKKALGIEGVKVSLHAEPQSPVLRKRVKGEIHLTALSDNVINTIEIRMVERYSRGRKEDKLVNDYIIGRIVLDGPIDIKKDELIKMPFEIPYVFAQSEMDKLGNKGMLFSGLVGLAKYFKKVKSTYRIIAEVNVKGTKLHPFAETEVELIGNAIIE